MKKKIVLLSALVMLMAGCSVINIHDNDIDKIVNNIIYKTNTKRNVNFEGYSYFVPKGLTFMNKDTYNATFRDGYGNVYYLYVDAISYYHGTKNKFKEDKSLYYSKKLKKDKKFGYLEITERENDYFIEAMYNYAKIEVYADSETLTDTVADLSTLLSSIKYNKKVLNSLIGDNKLVYKEEKYNIFETSRTTDDFLDYVNEYDKYYDKKGELPDEDSIDIESDEE